MNPHVSEERGFPADTYAEKTILGATLLDNAYYLEAQDKLAVDDFWLDSHQRIYRRVGELLASDHTVDLVTLGQELDRHKELAGMGGMSYLASLTEGLPRQPVISDYVEIVKDKSLLRQMIKACSVTMARAEDQSEPALKVLWDHLKALTDAAEQNSGNEVWSSAELALESIRALVDDPQEVQIIPTGIRGLDELTGGGMRLGELWVVGAAPSRGKTTLARQIVAGALLRGIPTLVHSGEMSKKSWIDITACLLEGMPVWKIREPRLLNLTERERVRSGLLALGQLPLYISDAATVTLERLLWNATRERRHHGVQLLVVDYAQIISAPGKEIREQVAQVAYRLRDFAKTENVAVLLLSQSPRPQGRDINSKPNMHSLKESGALEEVAHVVVLPYRPIDIETSRFTGEDELIIAKNRNGFLDSVPTYLDGEYLHFKQR
jgi:replicative DNA helicase